MPAPSVSDLAAIVKRFESGGDYSARNPNSTASGAYQFTNPTWRQYAGQIGVDTGQYPSASAAPPPVQDAVFAQAVAKRGLGDWTCPGCDPRLADYVSGMAGNQSGPGAAPVYAQPMAAPDTSTPNVSAPAPATPNVSAPAPAATDTPAAWRPSLSMNALSSSIAPAQPAPVAPTPLMPLVMPGALMPLARRLA